jgi:hypothetical protein
MLSSKSERISSCVLRPSFATVVELLEQFGLPVFSLLIIATLSRDETRIIKVLKCCFAVSTCGLMFEAAYTFLLCRSAWAVALSSQIWPPFIGTWPLLTDLASLHWDVASPSQIWPLSIELCPLIVYSIQSYPFGTRVLSAGKLCGYKGLIT